MKVRALVLSCLIFAYSSHSMALDPTQKLSPAPPMSVFESWAKPITPFEMAPNVWYVGTNNLSSILLTTPKGHVLIDGALDQNAPLIKANIESLGFKLSDVRYLLNSHARLDQAGGLARLKQWSGGTLIASKENAKQLAVGGKEDFALGDALLFPSVKVDKIIEDQDSFSIGGVQITALFTPGHLPGATSWKIELANGQTAIYADSLATPDYYLINNKNYPNIVTDMTHSFEVLSAQSVDIFIASKGERFDLANKIAAFNKGNKQAFIDREGLQKYVESSRQKFENQLNQQRKNAAN